MIEDENPNLAILAVLCIVITQHFPKPKLKNMKIRHETRLSLPVQFLYEDAPVKIRAFWQYSLLLGVLVITLVIFFTIVVQHSSLRLIPWHRMSTLLSDHPYDYELVFTMNWHVPFFILGFFVVIAALLSVKKEYEYHHVYKIHYDRLQRYAQCILDLYSSKIRYECTRPLVHHLDYELLREWIFEHYDELVDRLPHDIPLYVCNENFASSLTVAIIEHYLAREAIHITQSL
jgi:hypothetical protein